MGQLLAGPVLLTSLLAGVVALLAPCCVSVMLPAYLSTVFRRPSRVLFATVVFAAGVATVIVPIGLGASALSAVFQRWHVPLFAGGGVLMIAGGIAVLSGWSPKLPMPGMRAATGSGLGTVYGLGVFSGIASACCAPVLIGVTVLAGASGSFPAALLVSAAYVTGMVAPLLIMSLGFDRYGRRAITALQARRIPVYPGARMRVPLGGWLSGMLLAAMGVLTIALALSRPDMPNEGWRLRMAADLQHAAAVAAGRLSWLPGWILLAIAAATVVTFLAVRRRTRRATITGGAATTPAQDAAPAETAAPATDTPQAPLVSTKDGSS